jgi:hypothetical protein
VIPRKAKGHRPLYSGDPHTDKLYAMVMALAAETSVLRERLDTMERLLALKGVLGPKDIDAYVPDEPALAEREKYRAQFLERLLRVVDDEIQASQKDS